MLCSLLTSVLLLRRLTAFCWLSLCSNLCVISGSCRSICVSGFLELHADVLGVALFSAMCWCLVSAWQVKNQVLPLRGSCIISLVISHLLCILCSLFLKLLLFGYLVSWVYLLITKTFLSYVVPVLGLFVCLFCLFLFLLSERFPQSCPGLGLGEESEAQALV